MNKRKKYIAVAVSEVYWNINEGRETPREIQLCICSVPITSAGLDFAERRLSLDSWCQQETARSYEHLSAAGGYEPRSVRAFPDITPGAENSKAFP